ncbi:hypothetical protein pb186bvf_009596 [Paramecium bursaria]
MQLPCEINGEKVEEYLQLQNVIINEPQIIDNHDKFLGFMKENKKQIYGLNTYLIGQNPKQIDNIKQYEQEELGLLLKIHSDKYLCKQLSRLTVFVLLNNLCNNSGISLKCIKQLIDLLQTDIQLPATNYNNQYYDASINFHLTQTFDLEEYDRILITSMKSLSYATVLHNTKNSIELFDLAIKSTALAFEANNGVIHAYSELVNQVKLHDCQKVVATKLFDLLTEDGQTSQLNQHLKQFTQNNLQDAYSLRCVPQVLGASLQYIEYVKKFKPGNMFAYKFIYEEDQIIDIVYTQENNNEQEMIILDNLSISLSEIGGIAERRIQRLMNPKLQKLDDFYEQFADSHPYKYSQLANYASNLIFKNKRYCQPISSDSMPQTTYIEDINNCFEQQIKKLYNIIKNTEKIIKIDTFISILVIEKIQEKCGKKTNIKIQQIVQQLKQVVNDIDIIYT